MLSLALGWLLVSSLPAAAPEPDPADEPAAGTTSSTGFEVRWQVLSAGGGASGGGDFRLRGSAGQVDASVEHPAAGPSLGHTGGFWVLLRSRGQGLIDRIFSDSFERP